MLLGGELGADAVHFDVDPGVTGRVPLDGDHVQAARIADGLDDPVAERNVDV